MKRRPILFSCFSLEICKKTYGNDPRKQTCDIRGENFNCTKIVESILYDF